MSFDWAEERRRIDSRFKDMDKVMEMAHKEGTLVGQYFSEDVADGHATYIVTEVKGAMARIELVADVDPDMYEHSYFGQGRWIEQDYVIEATGRIRAMKKLFGGKK
jgi:hypothetical protein